MPEGSALKNVAVSQTDISVVAAHPGKKIRVRGLVLAPGGVATAATFNSKGAGAGNAISPLFAMGANIPVVLPNDPDGWFETAPSEALTITTGSGSTLGVLVNYDLR